MPILTIRNTRTLTGYAITLLEYPRWIIERDVDFTNCHLSGGFDTRDAQCRSCQFGAACRWLNLNQPAPRPDTPLEELLRALRTAVEYMKSPDQRTSDHDRNCGCDSCEWLREAVGFLRIHRHKT